MKYPQGNPFLLQLSPGRTSEMVQMNNRAALTDE